MILGIPKELKDHETRVALIPEAVARLVKAGHPVWVQRGAGLKSGYADALYRRAGARLSPNAQDLYRRAELIIKVKEPLPAEYPGFRPGLKIFCYLHLAANPVLTRALQKSGVTALAFETLQDTAGRTPLLRPMSEIAGRLSVTVGAHYLQSDVGGKGVLLSGSEAEPGGKVVVVGGGAVGRAAAETALGLGAEVSVFDLRPQNLRDWLRRHTRGKVFSAIPQKLAAALRHADLVVGAVYVPGAKAPQVLRASMVRGMEPGSVLVDVAVDQGGTAETTHPTTHSHPVYVRHGVIHYAVTNMPALVGRTATQALSRAIEPYVAKIAALNSLEQWRRDAVLYSAVNVAQGKILNPGVKASLP